MAILIEAPGPTMEINRTGIEIINTVLRPTCSDTGAIKIGPKMYPSIFIDIVRVDREARLDLTFRSSMIIGKAG
jgi:hypothetical protein